MNSLIGIFLGFGLVITGFILEGGNPVALLSLSSLFIVLGGTVAATIISFPVATLKKVPQSLKAAFGNKKADLPGLISFFKDISTKTRRNGLLSLETEIANVPDLDPFIKKGLQMVVDGIEPQSVRNTLELEAAMMSERHHHISAVFDAAGGYSPTMGIIGTAMGLVHILGSLSDTSTLGEKIAVAFIATLYGISFANLIWLPLGSKLKTTDADEVKEKELIIEAVTLIQEGANPNVVSERLRSFLDKAELEKFEQMDKAVEV